MINQFESGTVNICGDVPDPMSVKDVLGLVTNLADLANAPSLNVNSIVCGMLAIPTNTPSELFAQTCPGMETYYNTLIGTPPNVQTLNTTFGCNEEVIKLMTDPLQVEDIYNNLGTAILTFFPQGENYASARKFIDYDKWWLIGFLALIWAAFFVAYWFTSKLSIRLVKR